jgi:D-sedoheptulose 7-phosphate isomerase
MPKIIDIIKHMTDTSKKSNHIEQYFDESARICRKIDKKKINELVEELVKLRIGEGRLFVLGIGGSAANASHFVNDFRKLCNIETYAPTDGIAELTARANDEGWETIFKYWLEVSKLCDKDALMCLSVGGGSKKPPVSVNIIEACNYAKKCGAKVYGICGKSNGYIAKNSDLCITIPRINPKHTTAHSESFQSIILHALVSHPFLQLSKTKW